MEHLRTLTWAVDPLGQPASDVTSDTTDAPAVPGCPGPTGGGGGTGLSSSPSGTLRTNTAGWVDYVDRNGCLLGGREPAPDGTAFVRRWSIQPLPGAAGGDTLLLQVVAFPSNGRVATDPGGVTGIAHLISLKTRRAQ
jgi:hypothetical protein